MIFSVILYKKIQLLKEHLSFILQRNEKETDDTESDADVFEEIWHLIQKYYGQNYS